MKLRRDRLKKRLDHPHQIRPTDGDVRFVISADDRSLRLLMASAGGLAKIRGIAQRAIDLLQMQTTHEGLLETLDGAIVLRGWRCECCGTWTSDEKERHETCRLCEMPRPSKAKRNS